MKIYNYNVEDFNFAEIYCHLVECSQLELLHESSLNTYSQVFSREKDQGTVFHKLYYQNYTAHFQPVYEKFIQEVVYPIYNCSIVYQAIPTFRVHLPGNIAVGEFHKDKWYRDQEWHQSVAELNFYLPFTQAYDSNTIWVESREDSEDYSPIEVKYGELVQWDGVNLKHGNKTNQTPTTRVSVDFRVMELSNYMPSNHGSINTGTKFEIGGYYKLLVE